MATKVQHILFLSLLLALATLQSIHAIKFTIINKVPNSAGGKRFSTQIGTKYTRQTLSSAANFIWRTFKQTTPSQRKNVKKVTLYIENMDGVAYAINNEIHLSANYIARFSAGSVKREITGVLYHELTHVLQWNGKGRAPGGLIEGVADYVRLKAGYAPSHWVKAGAGKRWDQGYDVTARFLVYCDGLMIFRKGFVALLNGKMKTGYSNYYFVELLGKSPDALWLQYKARFS